MYRILILSWTMFVFCLVSAETYSLKQKKIVDERIKLEKDDVAFSLKVAEEEYKSLVLRLQQVFATQKKIEIYRKSARMMKQFCHWYDVECRLLYDKTEVYLDDEQVRVTQEGESLKKARQQSMMILQNLKKRIAQLEAGVPSAGAGIQSVATQNSSMGEKIDSSLISYFYCDTVKGWNIRRGIFLTAENSFNLPLTSHVLDVYQEGDHYFLTLRIDKIIFHFAYTGDPQLKKGDTVPSYVPLFNTAAKNPIKENSVLMFGVYHGNLVDISELCKERN